VMSALVDMWTAEHARMIQEKAEAEAEAEASFAEFQEDVGVQPKKEEEEDMSSCLSKDFKAHYPFSSSYISEAAISLIMDCLSA
ncbi:hypothetical protein Dimus_025487, partial [Dionaea muscipula]